MENNVPHNTLILPGSKSITNRDLLLAALVDYPVKFSGVLESDDTEHMIQSLNELGANIEKISPTTYLVKEGVNQTLDSSEKIELDVGQSGTCMRFLVGLAAILENEITLKGEEVLMGRPLEPLLTSLENLGVKVESQEGHKAPVTIQGLSNIQNREIEIDGSVSSQFITALMQIGAFIPGGLCINIKGDLVSKPYIDITIHELEKFGIRVDNNNYRSFHIMEYETTDHEEIKEVLVEGDASALSYIANYFVLHGGSISIDNLGKNTKQGDYKYLEVLKKAFGLSYLQTKSGGTQIEIENGLNHIKEVDLSKEYDFESMPDVSMSFMTLAMFLPGDTKITGLQTLNAKECERLTVMHQEIEKLGVTVESDDTSIKIGEYSPENHEGLIEIETYNDHRIAMTFGVLQAYLGEKYKKDISVLNPECVNKTYPNFWDDLKSFK